MNDDAHHHFPQHRRVFDVDRVSGAHAYTRPAQGEPVAFRCVSPDGDLSQWHDYHVDSHAAALVDVQKGLINRVELSYTHADPAEVERLRDALDECDGERWKLRTERDTLRAQLAEAHALLRETADSPIKDHIRRKIDTALSASAEPSAPAWACQSCQLEQPTDRPCDVCGGKIELIATKS